MTGGASVEADSGRQSLFPRIQCLDGIRGIAVLAVIVLHTFVSTLPPKAGKVDQTIAGLAGIGALGVDLFFVLSGFLITLILDRTRNNDARMKTFYIRRVLRIFPVYYAVLLFIEVVLGRLGPYSLGTTSHVWQWLYLSNVSRAIYGPMASGQIFGHFWSLSVEEHFYLIWPVIVFHTTRGQLIRISVAIFFVSALAYGILAALGYGETAYVLTPTHMYSLASGSLVAMLHVGDHKGLPVWSRRIVIASTALLLLAVPASVIGGVKLFTATAEILSLFAFPALIGALVTGQARSLREMLSARWLTRVGKYSYAMYVLHIPIIRILIYEGLKITRGPGGYYFPHELITSAVVALLSFAAAFVSWHLLEKQFLKLAPPYRQREQKPVEMSLASA